MTIEFPSCEQCGRKYQPDDIPQYCRGCGYPLQTVFTCPHCGEDINKPPEEILDGNVTEPYFVDGGIPTGYPSPSPYSEWANAYPLIESKKEEPEEEPQENLNFLEYLLVVMLIFGIIVAARSLYLLLF